MAPMVLVAVKVLEIAPRGRPVQEWSSTPGSSIHYLGAPGSPTDTPLWYVGVVSGAAVPRDVCEGGGGGCAAAGVGDADAVVSGANQASVEAVGFGCKVFFHE